MCRHLLLKVIPFFCFVCSPYPPLEMYGLNNGYRLDYAKIPWKDKMAEVLTAPELKSHPELIQKLINDNNRTGAKEILFQVLSDPLWADHPEYVEQVSIFASEWGKTLELKRLLRLPHWQDHPAINELKNYDEVDMAKFRRAALRKFPQHQTFFDLVSLGCRSFFSKTN